MKLTPWWIGGGAGLAIFGLVALAVGFFQPGWPDPVEISGSAGKSSVTEVKQKTAEFRSKVGKLDESKKKIDDELSKHRVFVSRSLVFLPKQAEPVQPLNLDQVTEDGIQVGWRIQELRRKTRIKTGLQTWRSMKRRRTPKTPPAAHLNGIR